MNSNESSTKNNSLEQEQTTARILKNTVWLFNGSIIIRVLNLTKGIILARLLLPNDFGLFGLASIVIGFFSMFSDAGAGIFLIYKQVEEEHDKDTAFWINFLISTVVSLFITLIAPFISTFYKEEKLIPVLVLLTWVIWLNSISMVHRHWLRKKLKLRSIGVFDVIVNLVSFFIAVLLAKRGCGVWAFIASTLGGNIVNFLLLIFWSKWIPQIKLSMKVAKEIAPFSLWYIGHSLSWYLALNLDNLLIGKYLGMKELGIYTLAYNYALVPITLIANPLGNVIFPELALKQNNLQEFWRVFNQSSKLFLGAVCPIACSLFVAAPDLFPLLLGDKWNSAIIPFQILCVYVLIRCLWVDPIVALGKFNLGLYIGSLTSMLLLPGISLFYKWGLVGIAYIVLVVVGSAHILALFFASKSVQIFVDCIKNTLPFLLIGLCSIIFSISIRYICGGIIGGNKLILSFLDIAAVLGVYGIVFRNYIKNLFSYLKVKI